VLDIDLLAGAKLPVSRDIIYAYRSGFVRRQVRLLIHDILNRKGYNVLNVDAPHIASAPFATSLVTYFDETALICDVGRFEGVETWQKGIDHWFKAIASRKSNHRLCLIVPAYLAKRKAESCKSALEVSTFIEEPQVTSENADIILPYLMGASGLFDFSNLKGKSRLKCAFRAAADQRDSNWSLREAFHAFEELCLAKIDPATNTFRLGGGQDAGDLENQTQLDLHSKLAEFLAEKSLRSQISLLLLLDERLHSQKIHQMKLSRQLLAATRDLASFAAVTGNDLPGWVESRLSKGKVSRMKRLPPVDKKDMKLWAVTLGRGVAELEQGNFLFSFERLCRRYISQRDIAYALTYK
jgi:hypothetical protein